MFSRHISKINRLLDGKPQQDFHLDLLSELPRETPRSRATSRRHSSTPKPKYTSEIKVIQADVPKNYVKVLEQLYRAKCASLVIDFNQSNWETFLKAFVAKNKIENGQLCNQTVNFTDFALGETCLPQINQFLKENPSLVILKLSKNEINPNNLVRLQTIKELWLGNCKLGTEALEQLFQKLHKSVIQKLSLSSLQLKNRNQLTKYKALISLIQSSNTLHTLELANMDINPSSMIIESCKNTTVKHLDLNDNTHVKGICNTLLSLNLSRNSIIVPFTYPMMPNDLLVLNLSYNKIPSHQFRQFLKLTYFANLRQLIVDHVSLQGDLTFLQYFLEQSPTMQRLSMVDCNLSQSSFFHVAHGVKHSHSLEILDLSWNRFPSEKVAEYIAHMLQGSNIKEIKLRHCDIKDTYGQIIFKNIRKCKNLQKMNLTNNLLGDKTAKTICSQLNPIRGRNQLRHSRGNSSEQKYAKTLICLQLEENIIKYSDIQQINSYLESNKYFSGHRLDKEYQQLLLTNKQIEQANMILNSEAERINQLQKETNDLHLQYMTKFKVQNQERKKKLRNDIYDIRDFENQLMTDITLLQSLPTLSDLNSMQSRKESFISHHESFNNL